MITKQERKLIDLPEEPIIIEWSIQFAKSLKDQIINWTAVTRNEEWRLSPDIEENKDAK